MTEAIHSERDRWVYPLGRASRFSMTPEQAKFYRRLLEFEKKKGRMPRFREAREFCGLASKSTVHWFYRSLTERGWMQRTNRTWDGYELTEPRMWFPKVPEAA